MYNLYFVKYNRHSYSVIWVTTHIRFINSLIKPSLDSQFDLFKIIRNTLLKLNQNNNLNCITFCDRIMMVVFFLFVKFKLSTKILSHLSKSSILNKLFHSKWFAVCSTTKLLNEILFSDNWFGFKVSCWKSN